MQWFKHYTDNHRGRTVQGLQDEFGPVGVVIYYFLIEMCAEKAVAPRTGDGLSADDCVFAFHWSVVERATRAKRSTVSRVLVHGQSAEIWKWSSDGREVVIEFPMLLNLLDSDQKRPRAKRATPAPRARLEENRREEKRIDKNRREENIPAPAEKGAAPNGAEVTPEKIFELWNSQCDKVLPAAISLSTTRKRKLISQSKKFPSLDHWEEAIKRIKKSKFCMEKWRPSFDDFISENKRTRLLEGVYDDKGSETVGAKTYTARRSESNLSMMKKVISGEL